jgi:apolipoprotein N-acyltransferase
MSSTAPACARWGGITVAATTGWWFGFGYFLAGLYWVGYAFLVDAPFLMRVETRPS